MTVRPSRMDAIDFKQTLHTVKPQAQTINKVTWLQGWATTFFTKSNNQYRSGHKSIMDGYHGYLIKKH